jgi:hypothetical protein
MTLLEHNTEILRRMQDLRPIEPALKRIFEEGKRFQLLRGTDAQGRSFQPIKPATREERRGAGPPLAPQGPNADIVTRYAVRFENAAYTLVVIAGWPMEWVRYHIHGGPKLPRRDPSGFREQDKKEAMKVMQDWVMKGRA